MRHGLYTMQLQRLLGSVLIVACVTSITACNLLEVPGRFPLVGPPPAPIVPEPAACGSFVERPVMTSARGEPIYGAADLHIHQFSNLGFGGRMLWGSSFDDQGIERALSSCGVEGLCLDNNELTMCREVYCRLKSDVASCQANCELKRCEDSPPHGHFGLTDPVGAALGEGLGHVVHGYPDFEGWPHWNTYTHQQVYYRWLRRAFDGGLKLIVVHAVSNEVLCEVLGHRHACDDMSNVDLQLDAARELEAFVDKENDCKVNGNGWYRIAKTPQEARDIIASGAMAVVLGIEVDTLFDCHLNGSCTPESVRAKVAEYKAKGVTHVFPVHVFDNGLGGTAADSDFFNFGNLIVNKGLLDVRDCSSEGYEFHFDAATSEVNNFLSMVAAKFGVKYDGYPKHKAHCNNRRLSPLGDVAIKALMGSHMIIDVDHMSVRTRADVFKLAHDCGYAGLVSGHSGFTDLYMGAKKHEGQLTAAEVKTLVDMHGMLAPILHQGSRAEVKTYARAAAPNPVIADCGNSAKSFAQAYLYAVDKMQGGAVAFGSDLNGLAGMPTPRFGPYACGGDGAEQTGKVQYPIDLHGFGDPMPESQAGYRKFDINVDGYAHVGMFPDFVAELRALGVSETDLLPLFSSAEAYIQLWERAEQAQLQCPASDGA